MAQRRCAVCDKPHDAKGYCHQHYKTFKRYGHPVVKLLRRPSPWLEWLWAMPETDACIERPGVKPGYWRVTIEGRQQHAHVVVCEWTHGPRPPGHEVAHSCGNASCTNPRHLRWATPLENAGDTIIHGRTQRGQRQWNVKLTDDDVLDIRRRWVAGERQKDLALEFGVKPPIVNQIVHRKRWAWLS